MFDVTRRLLGGIEVTMTSLSTGAAAVRSDEKLIVASREDPGAFRELYDRWAEPILAYFVRRVLDVEVAAGLMAETFAAAYESRGRFQDVGRPGGAWLYGIARRKLSHFYRHRRVEMKAARRLGMERAPRSITSRPHRSPPLLIVTSASKFWHPIYPVVPFPVLERG
jgi:DNA-directed RNA polymerase specialized sigma24 family protein